MEPKQPVDKFQYLHKVTPLSKYLALTLFVVLPFVGGWIGYTSALTHTNALLSAPLVEQTNVQPAPENTIRHSSTTIAEETDRPTVDFSDFHYTFTYEGQTNDWLVRKKRDFVFQNIPGTVRQLCAPSGFISGNMSNFHLVDGLKRNNSSPHFGKIDFIPLLNNTHSIQGVCHGLNIFVLSWNDKEIILDSKLVEGMPPPSSTYDYDAQFPDTRILLDNLFFNEGTFSSAATSSTKNTATLLITTNNIPCLEAEGVCFFVSEIAYFVELPSGTLLEYKQPNNGFIKSFPLPSLMSWNEAGTKAIYEVPCPAGCPEEIVEVYNVLTGEVQTLLSATDFPELSNERFNLFRTSPPIWIDNSTIRIQGQEYIF